MSIGKKAKAGNGGPAFAHWANESTNNQHLFQGIIYSEKYSCAPVFLLHGRIRVKD